MANMRSRAYKLQLSLQGIELFLRCHCRLCHKVGDFLPYGTTLFVAVALLHRCEPDTVVDELLAPELPTYGGRLVRFVGTSPTLSEMIRDIAMQIEVSDRIHPAPPVWKIFLAALGHMEGVTDPDLVIALRHAAGSGRKDK